MKKIILTLAAVTLAAMSFAQSPVKAEAEKTQSKAEVFSERSGTLVQRQYSDVGKLKSVTIQVATFTDLIQNQKTTAVRFEKSVSADSKLALLDADEVEALIKSLNIMKDKVYATTPTDYTEVTFRSRSGFSAGCYFSKGKWSAYMKLEKYDSDSYAWLDVSDTQPLIDLLTQAKQKL